MFDKDTENKIRLEYENGEHLKNLAIKYKVSLNTLKKRKKQSELGGNPWIKGKTSKLRYEDYVEGIEKLRIIALKKINDKARRELDFIEEMVEVAYESRNQERIIKAEKEFEIRIERVKKTLSLKKELEGICTDKEELEKKKIKIEIELKKQELEEKRLDYEVKKLTADHYLKKR